MYKVGDSVQCFSFNSWYDAKILSVSARYMRFDEYYIVENRPCS